MNTETTNPLVGEGASPPPGGAAVPGPAGGGADTGPDWVEVATVKELIRHKKKYVEVGEEKIALFYAAGQVYALYDVCIHKQRSLAKGVVMGDQVVCPGHQWCFELETGWAEDEEQCQPSYDVRVEDGLVYVNPIRRIARSQ